MTKISLLTAADVIHIMGWVGSQVVAYCQREACSRRLDSGVRPEVKEREKNKEEEREKDHPLPHPLALFLLESLCAAFDCFAPRVWVLYSG